jgi:hypothetical protein
MRNISFSLTTKQFRARTKDVTRRMGWLHLKPGDRLMGCEKCMGRKPGEPLVRLGEIEVVSAHREPIRRMIKEIKWGQDECRREGFPHLNPYEFVTFFCESHGLKVGPLGSTDAIITRIEFRYIDPAP